MSRTTHGDRAHPRRRPVAVAAKGSASGTGERPCYRRVPLRADPDDDAGSLLCAPDGEVLAGLTTTTTTSGWPPAFSQARGRSGVARVELH